MKVKIGKYPKKSGERKYKVKISNHDVFSADVTLAIVILPVLKNSKNINKELHRLTTSMFPRIFGAQTI